MGDFPKLAEGTSLQVGTHKVKIIQYLSEGGFAHIYKVSIDPIEQDSNIACLKRVILKDKSGLNNMRREVDVMKTLRHARNIVRYYDSHAERLPDGTYQVLVLMELCPNKSLLEYMNAHIKTKLKEHEILNIILDIGQGIYGMHQLKLIHRDIKIENVLIDSKHRFKLCDFGSTTGPVMPPQDQNQFNFIRHDIIYHTTPQYRAPEMIDLYRGFPIDEKADIWAFGCFLYKLCYYTTPFEAQGDIAILHASFQFLPEPHFSGDLKNLIIIMLQENPMFRPNIVQVLMLVSKIMGFEFSNLGLEDIYKLGPYNFQALHEFQLHKQNEIIRQKQAYYQQQLIASQSNVSLANGSVAPQISQGNLASGIAPPRGNSLEIPSQESNLHRSSSTTSSAALVSEQTTPAKLEIPAIRKDNTTKSASSGSRLSSSEVDIDDEFSGSFVEDLEDAEERYPSLDELDKTELEGAEERYPAIDDFKDEVNRSSPNLEVPRKKENIKQHKSTDDIPAIRHEYHSIEAWQKQQNNFVIDKEAERLMDDIFSGPSVKPSSSESREQKQEAENVKVSNLTEGIENLKIAKPSEEPVDSSGKDKLPLDVDLLDFSAPIKEPSLPKQSPEVVSPIVAEPSRKSNPFPLPMTDMSAIDSVQSEISVSSHKARNPWGDFRLGDAPSQHSSKVNVSVLPNENAAPQQPVALGSTQIVQQPVVLASTQSIQQPIVSATQSIQSPIVNTQSLQSPIVNTQSIQQPAITPEEIIKQHPLEITTSQSQHVTNEILEPNLIDLEVGLISSSSSSVSLLNTQTPKQHPEIDPSQVSLIDLDLDEEPVRSTTNAAGLTEPKPAFKKRINSRQSSSRLSFQEEIIDFDGGQYDNMDTLRNQLAQLVLLVPPESIEVSPDDRIGSAILKILQADYRDLFEQDDFFHQVLSSPELLQISRKYPSISLIEVLVEYVDTLSKLLQQDKVSLHLLAICFLQLFIQANFTGPSVSISLQGELFGDVATVQSDSVRLLNLEGQQAYDLMQEPIYLILAELIFEKLLETPVELSLFNKNVTEHSEKLVDLIQTRSSQAKEDPIYGSIFWWKVRTLQVHLSVLSEPPSIISTISGILLNNSIATSLTPSGSSDSELQRLVQIQLLLERARIHIHAQTEHSSITPLVQAKRISEFNFLLSGAKAKRTKFQKFHNSVLLVLAKSNRTSIYDSETIKESPENFNLDSDLLLERPQFESLDDLELKIEPDTKRIKFDTSEEEQQEDKLLPIAIRQDDIPNDLKELDPNNQPPLSNIDNLQLLLRLTVLRQTSPAKDPLVEEELMALVSRVLYSTGGNVNWLIFSRSLWERSLLETEKSRTVERGILQMTSLIEEIGIKIKTKIIPEAMNEDPNAITAQRLRFIHQLPLLPQWSMDVKLAEKYMSLGILKSALDIYERLQLPVEAALCYAAVNNEPEAERILLERINTHPDDARAVSILGDIRQDPQLWLKAWEIGRYAKAKASLSKYYHDPPANSGLARNIDLSIQHMHDSLSAYPLSYENWFFYGCCGLESQQFELASEAFTRCVALDDTNSYAWSNLASALLKLDKSKPAFNALKRAIRCGGENKKSWRIYENYMIVAAKLHEWNDVLIAAREMIDIKKNESGDDSAIDIPVLEKLVEILVSSDFDPNARLTHYQTSCIDLICNILPKIITSSSRCWRIVARVELWRKRPWEALECHERAYRAVMHNPELESNESVWNEVVDACGDLVSAYESLGELPGRHGADDLVCKDWKYKARTTVRSLMSKGKDMWEDSPGWDRLQEMKSDLSNS
ncbi:Essential for maintenance of the cell wall protein 1 [Spathaspora sp. JA1]|nr:Essential for maintenance of the cell wall protein 1 [Spathaspora sp. JA1]